MGWNANSVSDETLHRRRLVFEGIGIICAMAVIVGTLMDTNQGFSAKDLMSVIFGLAGIVYFGSLAVSEWRHLRRGG